jgi:transaldolase
MSRLNDLREFGQSPWYDNIERGLLLSGGLKKMIDEDGIAGVTSNPSIFEKAINGSNSYDRDIEKMSKEGKDVGYIYDELTTSDVSNAADILSEVHKASGKVDGYVSIEVSPHLAHDTQTTVNEAKRLAAKIGKENLMIKIPATVEGIPAIKQCIADGLNINVTLIFSQAHYQAVAKAYIDSITERVNKGLAVDQITSVASFFVSRIDTQIDKMLDDRISKLEANDPKTKELENLRGKAAVAQSKVMYEQYRKLFYGNEFSKLKQKKAKVQRLLFGSTSTKNPAYSDVKYVEEIIGEGTINTLPQVTVEAFRDHGKASSTLREGVEEAKAILKKLNSSGIIVEEICQKIQDDGVAAFSESYDKLLDSLEKKKRQFAS